MEDLKLDLKYKVMIHVGRPVGQVFEAVADPKELSSYFTTGGASGRLEAGKTVMWDFADFPGAFPVEVEQLIPDQKIVLRWAANEGGKPADYKLTVTMCFKPTDDGRTLVEIEEKGWHDSEAGLRSSYGNCMGWSQMLCALKAWVEYGINLREGAYK
jgi:uncharacterized protein YndB with AHSA1/START domain